MAMDIRITDDGVEILEGEVVAKDVVVFISYLIGLGGYWEIRESFDGLTVHDKDNNKYKGTIEEIKNLIEEDKE
jgi:hypothetical protein